MVRTIPTWHSWASFKVRFLREVGTTLRFLRNIVPSKTEKSHRNFSKGLITASAGHAPTWTKFRILVKFYLLAFPVSPLITTTHNCQACHFVIHIVLNIHHKHSLWYKINNYNRIIVKMKQMPYLCYNGNNNHSIRSNIMRMVDGNGAAINVIQSHFN